MENNLYVLGTVFLTFFAAGICLLLARHNRAQRWVGFTAALLAWGCSLAVLIQVLDAGPQVYLMGGWAAPIGTMLIADKLSALFGFMATSVMLCGIIYALHFKDKCGSYPAFIPLFLGMETGLLGAMYTGDLFSFFVFMELMVLSSVSLTAISDDRNGLEAAIKYLLLSGMGTLFLLLGITAMYTTFGTLNLADMAQQLATGDRPLLARAAAFMLTSAFLLKSAVFPFHFWQPDFHTTAPTPVSAMLSSVVVKVGIYGIIRMITLLFTQEAPQLQAILVTLGIVGIFYGSLSALRTHNGKRLLAYSTIGQVGFILVAMGWGSDLALVAAIVYAFNHAFIKSALLMVMGLVASRTYPKTLELSKIRGAGRKMPAIIGLLWFLGGMSLAGLPPLNGFISKLTVVRSGVIVEDWFPLFLAVFAGIMTSMYMFGTWQQVFQTKNAVFDDKENAPIKIKDTGDSPLAPIILITVCVLLGIYARPLISLAEQAVVQINDPNIYIQAAGLAIMGGGG